jgi:two-component system, OmpR family, sensor histidine kinase BaeS
MRSITTKLTLAFLLVGLTGAILVAVIVQRRTLSAFDQFINKREQETLVANLVNHYQQTGGWENLFIRVAGSPLIQPRFDDENHEIRRDWTRYILVDTDGTILFSIAQDQIGQQVPVRSLETAVALEVNGRTVGWLVLNPVQRVWLPDTPEALFLRTVNVAALLSSLVAAMLALVLGSVLAYTMTRTLRDLTDATKEITRGKLGRQVQVRSTDELGELAVSFNQMSLDLERITSSRRQMTADIAHDLRSPLSVISGYAEALSDGKLPGTPEVYDILHQETKQLSRLIDDLRTLSLADAGELSLTRQPADPRTFLERVAARHAVAAQEAGITIRVNAPANLPPVLMDVERMAQVFDNLILNSFRYTQPGGDVLLTARSEQEGLLLQVQDFGSGISPDDLPHIFNRFYRGDKARSHNGESGLGLAISRSIVEAQGGKIRAESTLGQGSLFTITLPI